MQLRAAGPRFVPAAPSPVVFCRTPGPARLAGARRAAATAGRAAPGLPDRLLRPVDAGNIDVLPRARRPLEIPGTPRPRRVRRLLREPGTRHRALRPARASRRAPAGDPVRPAVPRRRAAGETAAPENPPAHHDPGRCRHVLPARTARGMVDRP